MFRLQGCGAKVGPLAKASHSHRHKKFAEYAEQVAAHTTTLKAQPT